MVDLKNSPEIMKYDKEKPQILTESNYVENVHFAVGFASRCWDKKQVFDTSEALRLTNELCAYIRLIKEGKAE